MKETINSTDEAMATEILKKFAGIQDDQHGMNTPMRFLDMLREMTQCSNQEDSQHLKNCIKWTDFESSVDQLIIVEKIPFVSVCNHHVVPFVGSAHIGYIPSGAMAGLSKFGRVVKHYARQPQVQEELTAEIHSFIDLKLAPLGLAVVLRAEHMCMTLRGVQAPGSYTTTSQMTGVFNDHQRTAKAEFLQFINGNGHR